MLPLRFVLTPGQQHEATVVPDLVLSVTHKALRAAKVTGDKGYSSPAIRAVPVRLRVGVGDPAPKG